MHQRRLLGLVIVFAGLIAPPKAFPQSDYRVQVDSTLVVIPVNVTDASNHFVLNLGRDRFSVFEDGTKQRITQFADEDAPLSIGLLVDVSGSMAGKLPISQGAVAEFLKTMNPHDEAFLIEFSDHAELTMGFTSDVNAIKERMNTVQPGGLTALLDAVHLGLAQMKSAKNPRKALLILSDGGDNNSRYSAADIKEVVRQADVQIYSMGVFEGGLFPRLSAAEVSGPALLSEISEQTGGRVFPARSFGALPGIARRIGIELRNPVHSGLFALERGKGWRLQKGGSEAPGSGRAARIKGSLENRLLRPDPVKCPLSMDHAHVWRGYAHMGSGHMGCRRGSRAHQRSPDRVP